MSDNQTSLMNFSDALADSVARAGDSVARIEARPRQAASGILEDRLAEAEYNLELTAIRAPMKGKIIRTPLDPAITFV